MNRAKSWLQTIRDELRLVGVRITCAELGRRTCGEVIEAHDWAVAQIRTDEPIPMPAWLLDLCVKPFPQPGILWATCKCGRRVRRDDAARMVSHEAPECEWFASMVKQAGPGFTTTVDTFPVPDDEKPS